MAAKTEAKQAKRPATDEHIHTSGNQSPQIKRLCLSPWAAASLFSADKSLVACSLTTEDEAAVINRLNKCDRTFSRCPWEGPCDSILFSSTQSSC